MMTLCHHSIDTMSHNIKIEYTIVYSIYKIATAVFIANGDKPPLSD